MRDPGGPYAAAMRDAYYAPFEAATGVRVASQLGGVEPTALIRRMVDDGAVTWDLALVSHAAHLDLAASLHLAPIAVDTPGVAAIPARWRSEVFLGHDVYAVVLACRSDAFPAGGAPRRWADCSSVEQFPGARWLRRHPIDLVEQALLADGVAPAALYPCDLDRAFAALDRVRPHVAGWWRRAADTTRLLASGEAAICPTSNARAEAARDAGAPVDWGWEGALASLEGWAIPRGGPAVALARDFLAFAMTAERQAVFASRLPYAPTIPEALARVPAARARRLPLHPANAGGLVWTDQAWWAGAKDAAERRFEAWFGAKLD